MAIILTKKEVNDFEKKTQSGRTRCTNRRKVRKMHHRLRRVFKGTGSKQKHCNRMEKGSYR